MAQVEKEIQEKVDAAVKEIKEEHEARFEASKKVSARGVWGDGMGVVGCGKHWRLHMP